MLLAFICEGSNSVTVSSNICLNALWRGQKRVRSRTLRYLNCLQLIIITKRCSWYVIIGDVFKIFYPTQIWVSLSSVPYPWMVYLIDRLDWQTFSNISKNPPFAFKMQMNETRCMPESHVEKPTLQCRTHWHVIVFYVYSSLHTVFFFSPQN